MAIAETWKRAADAAAAVHQIRNRLQSIIIEAALLKRTAGGDPAALARIGALAQDGAGYLDLFSELLPRPALDGAARLEEVHQVFEECGVEARNGVLEASVRCTSDALAELMRTLLTQAIPFRGFRPTRTLLGAKGPGRIEVVVELKPDAPVGSSATVTPWMTAQQMARDVGGSLELHSGEPPVVKLHLPTGN